MPLSPERRQKLRQQSATEVPDVTDYDPVDTPTQIDRRKLEQERQELRQRMDRKHDAGDAFEAAMENDSVLSNLTDFAASKSHPVDPSYVPPEGGSERYKLLTKGVPAQYHGQILDNAVSEQHALFLRDQVKQEVENDQLLANEEWGTTIRVGANFFDPGAMAVGLLAAPLAAGAKATRLTNAVRSGIAAGGSEAAIETMAQSGKQTGDSWDIAVAGLGGLALGAPLGFALPTEASEYSRALKLAEQRVTAAELKANDVPLTAEGEAMTEGHPAFDQMAPGITPEIDQARNMAVGDKSAEAQKVAPMSAMANAGPVPTRWDVMGRLLQDDDPMVRSLASYMDEETVGYVDPYQAVRTSAVEEGERLSKAYLGKFYRKFDPAYDNWKKKHGIQGGIATRGEFSRRVTQAVRSGEETDEDILEAAKGASEAKEIFKMAQEWDVGSARNVPDNPNYVPRVPNYEAIRALNGEFGQDELKSLVRDAVRNEMPDIEDDVADTISHYYIKNLTDYSNNKNPPPVNGIPTDDLDELHSDLISNGISAEKAAAVRDKLQLRQENSGQPSRLKRRLQLDETASRRMTDRQGNERDVAISELYEDNIERLMEQYTRTMGGWTALAKNVGVRNRSDWSSMLNEIKDRGMEAGRSREKMNEIEQKLDFLFRAATGSPLERDPGSTFAKTSRFMRDAAFVSFLQKLGLAQLPEIGNMMATGGIRATLAHVPETKKILTRAKNGELEDQVVKELEAVTDIGTDRLLNQVVTRADEEGFGASGAESTRLGKLTSKADQYMQYAVRATGDLSGAHMMNMVVDRMGAKLISQKILDAAFQKKGLTDGQKQRLAGVGLDLEMQERVFTQMRQHATSEPSAFLKNGKIRALNLDDWDDPQSRDKFINAVHRESRRIVQKETPGSLPMFMSDTMGKFLMQFRRFMMGAWTKQTLRGAHMRDRETLMQFLMQTTFAGLGYTAQQAASGGDLEERLTPEELGKAAFQRTGMASMIPMMYDTASQIAYETDPTFSYRTSGMATQAFSADSVPAISMANAAYRSMGSMKALARDDYDFSREDLSNYATILPNFYGVGRGLEILEEELPKYSQEPEWVPK